MSSLTKFFLHPFNIFWALFLIGIVGLLINKEKIYLISFIAAAAVFFISSNFLLPKFLLSKLENQYSPFIDTGNPAKTENYNIVVLGAGFTNNKKLPYNERLSASALYRLIEGIRIHNIYPLSKLIVSGSSNKKQISQAEVYKKTAISLGVDSALIHTLNTPTNTFEEAMAYSGAFDKNTTVILVTSACHMPRAVMMFKHAGINVIPAPTDYQYKSDELDAYSFLPSMSNMSQMQTALVEYIGTLYAKWFLF